MKWPIILLLMSFQVGAQSDINEEMLNKFIETQRKMMQEMMKEFEEDDMIFDKLFDSDSLREKLKNGQLKGFGNLQGFRGIGGDFEVNQRTLDDGSMEVRIKPNDKNVNLDIKTENGMIIIKSEKKVTDETTGQSGNTSSSMSMSSYSRSISIPFGYQAKDPTADGDEIVIALVPKKKMKNGRVPIDKGDGDTL